MKRITILLLTIFALLAAGCGNERVWRIGVSQCSADDWRSKMNDEILSEELFHDNISIEIRSADDSSQKQIDDIRYFADNGFDIIIASPNEAEALTPVIREVFESGIPVVLFDRNIDGDYYTAWQGADNVEIGRSAAKYALRLAGDECRVIEIRGLDGSTPSIERREGFLQVAAEDAGRFRILGSGAGDWNAEKGRLTADSLLALYPQANIIYAHNDRMAIAAAEAAHDIGRDDIKIIGIDAAPEIGIRAVADGVLDATFLYPTEGDELISTALAILEGGDYERYRTLPTAPAVDPSNAEMILLQNKVLKEENKKIEWLKEKVDGYMSQQTSQRMALYSAVAVLFLFAGVIFLLLRAYWNHTRHRRQLDAKNRELEQQHDELNRLYQQVVEATQSRLSFFTSVSHDLRTPLTLIADPVEQMAAADNIDESQRTLMRLADKNVKILKRLINQILDFRKYEHGKLTLNLAETEPAALVAEWGESFRHAAVKKHIRLNVAADCPDGFTMALDVEKFERIFFNLLSNAFKYTPENESVTVSLRVEGDNLVLSVSDTGQGIGREDLEHIFDRFSVSTKSTPTARALASRW